MRITAATQGLVTAIRIALLAAVIVGPVGAFALANAQTAGDSISGAGLVLYVSLQRAG
jgi:hypothetical protein